MNLNQLRAALVTYRLWIAGAAAAVIGYTAYRNVAAQRSTPVALSGASGAEALAAAEQGGDLALRGVALGLGPTEAAIGLGQVALGVLGGAVGDLSGLAGQLGGLLGDVSGSLIENPPAASPPPPAPAPEPAPAPAPEPAPAPAPAPEPAPAPAPAPADALVRYDLHAQPGTYQLLNEAGQLRVISVGSLTSWVTDWTGLGWKLLNGPYSGWTMATGSASGSWPAPSSYLIYAVYASGTAIPHPEFTV